MTVSRQGVNGRLAEIAATLGADRAGLVDELYRRLSSEIEPLRRDESLLALLNASIESNIDIALQLVWHGIDADAVEVPPAAIEYARRLAQHDVPVRALVRAYRLGQDSFLQRSVAALEARRADPELATATAGRLTAIAFTYIDRLTEQVLQAYEDERERWLQQRNTDREACVRQLLRGDRMDPHATETTLGYQLTARRHLGVIVRAAPQTPRSADTSGPALFVRVLADWLGAGGPLFVPHDEVTGWAWLPLSGPAPTAEALRAALRGLRAEVQLAVGEPGAGVAGFRRSHQQARQVQAVLVAAGRDAPAVITFAEVGPVALMCGDIGATKAWVGETLGRLALDDDKHARLRETLRVFLATGGSYQATARRLALHRNSVHYRVRRAEVELGRPIEPIRLDVEMALKVCHWLGASVLT
jgi:DNA-binding PucR family transcriptional regulator